MLKIALTGPESSGKTTLSELLAKHFETDFIPEFAREYLEQTNGRYEKTDLAKIAPWSTQKYFILSAETSNQKNSNLRHRLYRYWCLV